LEGMRFNQGIFIKGLIRARRIMILHGREYGNRGRASGPEWDFAYSILQIA
jgi:hypothetical protein